MTRSRIFLAELVLPDVSVTWPDQRVDNDWPQGPLMIGLPSSIAIEIVSPAQPRLSWYPVLTQMRDLDRAATSMR